MAIAGLRWLLQVFLSSITAAKAAVRLLEHGMQA
jgi:hypothetical protein